MKGTSQTRIPTNCRSFNGGCNSVSQILQPTLSPTMPIEIQATSANNGKLVGTSQTENFILKSAVTNLTVEGNIYAIYLMDHIIIKITDFEADVDIINLQAFPMIHDRSDLNIELGNFNKLIESTSLARIKPAIICEPN
jgi:hypothetical protein